MKATIYFPDGTTTSYLNGDDGITEMFLKGEDRVLHVKYAAAPDRNVILSNFPMIITTH